MLGPQFSLSAAFHTAKINKFHFEFNSEMTWDIALSSEKGLRIPGSYGTFLLGSRNQDWLGVPRQLVTKTWNRQLYPEWTEVQGSNCWRGRIWKFWRDGITGD